MTPHEDAWYLALHSKIGFRFLCQDVKKTRSALYRVKAKLNDPLLGPLKIVQSRTNPEGEIWIMHPQPESQNAEDI